MPRLVEQIRIRFPLAPLQAHLGVRRHVTTTTPPFHVTPLNFYSTNTFFNHSSMFHTNLKHEITV